MSQSSSINRLRANVALAATIFGICYFVYSVASIRELFDSGYIVCRPLYELLLVFISLTVYKRPQVSVGQLKILIFLLAAIALVGFCNAAFNSSSIPLGSTLLWYEVISLNTAFCVVLLFLVQSLLLVSQNRADNVSPCYAIPSIFCMGLAILSLSGHLFGVDLAYRWSESTGMNIGTAVQVILVGFSQALYVFSLYIEKKPKVGDLWRQTVLYSSMNVTAFGLLCVLFTYLPIYDVSNVGFTEHLSSAAEEETKVLTERLNILYEEVQELKETRDTKESNAIINASDYIEGVILKENESVLGTVPSWALQRVNRRLDQKKEIALSLICDGNQSSLYFTKSFENQTTIAVFVSTTILSTPKRRLGKYGTVESFYFTSASNCIYSQDHLKGALKINMPLVRSFLINWTNKDQLLARRIGQQSIAVTSIPDSFLHLSVVGLSKPWYEELSPHLIEFAGLSILLALVGSAGTYFLIGLLKQRAQEMTEISVMRNRELKQSVEDKEVLLREVHHRVKNNLQVISSLLRLELRRIDSEVARHSIVATQTRIKSIALLYEMLHYSGSPHVLETKVYCERICQELSASFGKMNAVSFEYDIENFSLSLDSLVTCGLLLNELVTNALKHGAENEKEMKIRIGLGKIDDTSVVLTIAQSSSVDQEVIEENKQSDGLGMRLISALVSQLDGQLSHSYSSGFKTTITFPIEPENL